MATLLRDRAAAEDVTALAFERAFRGARASTARAARERAWLFGIARNAALDELRRRRARAALLADPADVTRPPTRRRRRLRRAAVRAALAALARASAS